MKHVVMFSGGVGSWATAKRVAERHGTDQLTLLFADTLMEDPDLYRFLDEAAANVGGSLVRISDGRTPWEIYFHKHMIGNSRIDPCSEILKRKLCRRWLRENCDHTDTTVYIGIDWTELHRFERAGPHWQPWTVAAPMCEEPYMDKEQVFEWLNSQGIRRPRLYDMGFAHNNCGGFCCKAGHSHFAHLLKMLPDVYAYHEQREQEFREHFDRDVAVLRDRSGGHTRPLTLRALRERIETAPHQPDLWDGDWGGCNCFGPPDDEGGDDE